MCFASSQLEVLASHAAAGAAYWLRPVQIGQGLGNQLARPATGAKLESRTMLQAAGASENSAKSVP